MNNQQFIETYYKSFKQGIPSKERAALKKQLDDFAKKNKDISSSEFNTLLVSEFKPYLDIYQRININQELASIRIILTIFFVLTLLGLLGLMLASS